LHRYKPWERKTAKKFFFGHFVGFFETGNKKSKIGKNMERKRHQNHSPQTLGKD